MKQRTQSTTKRYCCMDKLQCFRNHKITTTMITTVMAVIYLPLGNLYLHICIYTAYTIN